MTGKLVLSIIAQTIAVSVLSVIFTLKFVEGHSGSPLISIFLFGVPITVGALFNKGIMPRIGMAVWLCVVSVISCGVVGVVVFGY
ncbi:hypothetical protein IDJ81_13630 [Tsuneonella flava]|uniref:Uncharacterized protein n=1 Tax=Tsuneonella flava TaxID=2055955 RepID=A0ABX7KAS8_9SPHN|nr:hypothetical protein [Tsuneonella flava]QSB44339.1 hypothetical protein IDJ81_13630 [Tsuneonella flava]